MVALLSLGLQTQPPMTMIVKHEVSRGALFIMARASRLERQNTLKSILATHKSRVPKLSKEYATIMGAMGMDVTVEK
jgi:hypothetical protein